MQNWNYETDFDSYNQDSEMVRVTVYFNIDRDDDEVLEFGRLVFKKCYEIDVVSYSAYYLDGSERVYEPTQDDLKDWNHDIRQALQKQFARQTA